MSYPIYHCLDSMELGTWGTVVVSAKVERNPFWSRNREENEPEYLIENTQVHRKGWPEEGNIWNRLKTWERGEVEDKLAEIYETIEKDSQTQISELQILTALERAYE